MSRLDDGWCTALDRDTMLCGIYKRRPTVCRDFPVGGDDCITERAAPPPKRVIVVGAGATRK